jgi:two-component system cell cycle response regulator
LSVTLESDTVTSRILIVDDIPANVRLLESRLQAEYFDVRTAMNGRDALAMAERERIDLVLLDVMMPDMTGFEVCAALKGNPRTAHIPVVMVTSLDQAEDRVKGLESGADDFLTKPLSEVALVTRVKSLVRLKMVTDELEIRAAAMQSVGLDSAAKVRDNAEIFGRILVVDDRENSVGRIRQALRRPFDVEITGNPAEAIELAGRGDFDLIMISLSLKAGDGLRLCTQIKTIDALRQTPVLLITDAAETQMVFRALDLGVNDYIIRPIDSNELRARVRTQLRRKLYQDRLRNMVTQAVELSVTDPLTGLYNRRYLDAHLRSALSRADATAKPVCVLIFDIDHFKAINDAFGHDAGDDVLRAFSERLRIGVRGIDLVSRYGGEEFLLVMPDTDAEYASSVAERLRSDVEKSPFVTNLSDEIPVTVSIGIAEWQGRADTPDALVKRADQALYAAKRAGRNRVVASAA